MNPDPRPAPSGVTLASPRCVLGVDPGSRLCGWGLVEVDGSRLVSVDNGVVVLDASAPLAARLAVLLERLSELIAAYRPSCAAVEGIFQHKNARSALVLGQARGVALAALGRARLDVAEYTPQQIKKAVTGTGRADKGQVQVVVARRLGLVDPPQADAADAVAVAICHAQHLAFPLPVLTGVPAPNRPRKSRAQAQAALAALVHTQQRASGASPSPPHPKGKLP
jgi:crossover junction endodeoxyribonuclease RuvC